MLRSLIEKKTRLVMRCARRRSTYSLGMTILVRQSFCCDCYSLLRARFVLPHAAKHMNVGNFCRQPPSSDEIFPVIFPVSREFRPAIGSATSRPTDLIDRSARSPLKRCRRERRRPRGAATKAAPEEGDAPVGRRIASARTPKLLDGRTNPNSIVIS
jgi:hypothetical protein